jgi:hypothetical protein
VLIKHVPVSFCDGFGPLAMLMLGCSGFCCLQQAPFVGHQRLMTHLPACAVLCCAVLSPAAPLLVTLLR